MARWVAEFPSTGSSLILYFSPFGLSSALILMVAVLSLVLSMCAQLHSRVQNKEGSDEEMSAASKAADLEPGEPVPPSRRASSSGSEGGHGKKCGSSSGDKSEQGKKCINMSFRNSAKRPQHQDHDEFYDDEASIESVGALGTESAGGPMWKRSILMGERCEPPAFSGLILYDEHGNLVQDLPWRSPRTPPSPSLRQLLSST